MQFSKRLPHLHSYSTVIHLVIPCPNFEDSVSANTRELSSLWRSLAPAVGLAGRIFALPLRRTLFFATGILNVSALPGIHVGVGDQFVCAHQDGN